MKCCAYLKLLVQIGHTHRLALDLQHGEVRNQKQLKVQCLDQTTNTWCDKCNT